MELRITLRTEGERVPAHGFAGVMGATQPTGSREAEVVLGDLPDDFDLNLDILTPASVALTRMVDGVILDEDVIPVEVADDESEEL